ncbi:MAG: response regulator transcription factor [Solirubrobacteraceae bacterium]
MERLSAKDLRTVLDVSHELGAIDDPDRFRLRLLSELRRLVAYDIASWNVVSPGIQRARIGAVDPIDCRIDGDEELLGAYLPQNPLVRAADPARVLKFSDFLTLRELHRLDLYDAVYREREVERQIAFILPAPEPEVLGIALNRRRPDFSERDRGILEAARPLVVAAYEHAILVTKMRATLSALELAAESAGEALIVLDPSGRIQHATRSARAQLRALPGADQPGRLPEPLASWSEAQRCAAAARPSSPRPLAVGSATAWFVRGRLNGFDAIVFERPPELSPNLLRAAGLTSREAEVLTRVERGLSNTLIARELAVSERTVAKHLEHAFAKLGVSNRTAALARVRSLGSERATVSMVGSEPARRIAQTPVHRGVSRAERHPRRSSSVG